METFAFLHVFFLGIGLGIALGFPVGPMGVLIARRMVLEGLTDGIVTIFGVLLGDLFYAAVILFNLNLIIAFLAKIKIFLLLFLVFSLLWIGYKTLKEAHLTDHPHPNARALATDWVSAFLMSVATPSTPLVFAAVYALLNVANLTQTSFDRIVLLVGLSAGVFLWWWGFAATVTTLKARGYLKSNKGLFRFFGWALIIIAVVIAIMSFF